MKLLTTLLVLLAVLVALPFAVGVYAEGPTPTPDEVLEGYEDVFLDPPVGAQLPPLPTIPTRAEYEDGWTVPQWRSTPDEGDGGGEAADNNPHDCGEVQVMEIEYWTHSIPNDHGGGTAEGYAALYYGQFDFCSWWIRAVTGTRITYGGEGVDLCRVTGGSRRVYPPADAWWKDNQEVGNCTMDGARVVSDTKFVAPLIKWRVNGVHYVEDWNDDDEFWYEGGTTSLTKRVP